MNLAWKQILITFALSFVIGVGVGRVMHYHPFPPSPHRHTQKMLNKLNSKLHLSADQKQKIEAILTQTEPEMKALQAEMRPKFEAIRKETNEKISEVLDDNQKEKFQKMEAEWQARMQKRRQES